MKLFHVYVTLKINVGNVDLSKRVSNTEVTFKSQANGNVCMNLTNIDTSLSMFDGNTFEYSDVESM